MCMLLQIESMCQIMLLQIESVWQIIRCTTWMSTVVARWGAEPSAYRTTLLCSPQNRISHEQQSRMPGSVHRYRWQGDDTTASVAIVDSVHLPDLWKCRKTKYTPGGLNQLLYNAWLDCRIKSDLYHLRRQPVHRVSTARIPVSGIAHLRITVQLGV